MNNLHDSVPHPSYCKCLEHYSNSPSELVHTAFVELSTAHPLEKNSRFYHLPKLRYTQNKNCYNVMDTCTKKKKCHFFSNTSFIL